MQAIPVIDNMDEIHQGSLDYLALQDEIPSSAPSDAVIAYTKLEEAFPAAKFRLGQIFASYKLPLTDEDIAFAYFTEAAAKGHAGAMYHLYLAHWNGRTDKGHDSEQSLQWCIKSAEAGYPPAQFRLGKYHAQGIFVASNWDVAMLWYAKAAANGFREARDEIVELANNYRYLLRS